MANKNIIIALTGHPASGKGKAAGYLKKKYQARTFRFSAILMDMLKRLHLEITRENNVIMSAGLRKYFGEDILSKAMAEDINKAKNGVIVIDGVRRAADIKYLKNRKNFYLVGITADPKIRYKRQLLRKEKPDDAKKTFKKFLKEHKSVSDKNVESLIRQADIKINNDGGLKKLHEQIDQIILKS